MTNLNNPNARKFDQCRDRCAANTNPWAAPGQAPSLGGGCGIFGGNPDGYYLFLLTLKTASKPGAQPTRTRDPQALFAVKRRLLVEGRGEPRRLGPTPGLVSTSSAKSLCQDSHKEQDKNMDKDKV